MFLKIRLLNLIWSTQLKEIFYDWFGYNELLFHKIHNSLANISILKALTFLSDYVGEKDLFPVHFLLILILMHIYISYKGYRRNIEVQIKFMKIVFIMLFSTITGAILVYAAKHMYGFTRPYCLDNFHVNGVVDSIAPHDLKKCYESLPSGHSWYIATMVLSMWTIMNTKTKTAGVALVLLIGTTRIALGKHFPADVFYGYIIAIITVLFAHMLANNFAPAMRDKLKSLLKIVY